MRLEIKASLLSAIRGFKISDYFITDQLWIELRVVQLAPHTHITKTFLTRPVMLPALFTFIII